MAIPIYRGRRYQRGHGLGSLFRSIARIAVPVLKRTAVPALKRLGKSALKNIGREALTSGRDLASDVISGRPIKEAVKARGKEGIDRTLQRVLDRVEEGVVGARGAGPPGQRKRGLKSKGIPLSQRKPKKKRKVYTDIFS